MEVVYENKDLLVLEKLAGLTTTNEGKVEDSVENWLKEHYPNKLFRQGIVHRLDKGTSGLLVVAKNAKSLGSLREQFKKRKVKKFYLTLVEGEVVGEGEIKAPIARLRRRFGRFGVAVGGREARTIFRVMAKYRNNNKVYSLLKIETKTGRTHQIRVHLSYLGWPVYGDREYGGREKLGRPFLHAIELSLSNLVFKSKLPEELQKVLDAYEKLA